MTLLSRIAVSLVCAIEFLVVIGCGKMVTQIPPTHLVGDLQQPRVDDYSGNIISVRWPAVIDPSVKPEVTTAGQAIYSHWNGREGVHGAEGVSDLMTVASTYHAAELYLAITRHMPGATVILEPQFITRRNTAGEPREVDVKSRLTSQISTGDVVPRPIVNSSLPVSVAADLTDFPVTTFPFTVNVFSLYLRTPPALSPKTNGVLLAMKDELAFHPGEQLVHGLEAWNSEAAPFSAWYSGGVSPGDSMEPVPDTVESLPIKLDKIVLYPTVFEHNQDAFGMTIPAYVTKGRPADIEGVDHMLLHPHIENFAKIVTTVPAVLGVVGKSDRLLLRYIQSYEPSLAEAIAQGKDLSDSQRHNLQIIKKLLAAELKVRSKRDGELARWIIAGKYGESFRTARDQSYEGAKRQVKAAWMQVANAGLASASSLAVMSKAGGSSLNGLQMLTQMQAQLSSLTSAFDKGSQDFYSQFLPSLNALENATIEFGEQKIAVNITDQMALTRLLKDLYARNKLQANL